MTYVFDGNDYERSTAPGFGHDGQIFRIHSTVVAVGRILTHDDGLVALLFPERLAVDMPELRVPDFESGHILSPNQEKERESNNFMEMQDILLNTVIEMSDVYFPSPQHYWRKLGTPEEENQHEVARFETLIMYK